MKTPLHFFSSFFLLLALIFSTTAFGQTAPLEYYIQTYQLESGYYDGNGVIGSNPANAFTAVVELHDVPWIQLHFSGANLGRESYIIITSLYDGKWQKLDAVSIQQWQFYSAFFNGSSVKIELFLAPTDRRVFINVDEIVVGEWAQGYPSYSICGPTDDRIPSDQPATSRLLNIGCTAWIIPNGKFVSAGHCLDGSGANIVEFNVPPSLPNGTIQHPGPEDQYSVDVTTKIFTNGGIGNDWGVFEVFPNSITGLMPKNAQNAYWPLVQDLGPDSIRITGYGVDDGAANQTQQTHIGPNAGSSGTTMRYVTDTQGGNSGSPVINGLTNVAVGVHTHGGCTSSGGNNNGTSTFHAAFWAAVDQGAGGCPVELPSNPNPAHGQTGVSINLTELTWSNGAGALTNELYFGTSPGSLTLVQSGTLATSWTITGGPLSYGTHYYWQVIEIGDTCNSDGPVWSFETEQSPNIVTAFYEPFNDMTCWTEIGPLGIGNWSISTSNNAGGSAPTELELYWSPSFVGLSQLLSCPINSSDLYENIVTWRQYLSFFAAPGPVIGLAVTYDGGTTSTPLWEVTTTGDIPAEEKMLTFTPSASTYQLIFYLNGDIYNINWWDMDDLSVEYIVPVELTSFTANASEGLVELSWITATETNNQGFEVQRSSGGEFENIAFVNGHGTTSETQVYSFVEKDLAVGNYLYRLKQVDYDGTFNYSKVIEVEVPAPASFTLEQNYPNPFNPSTKIKFAIPFETEVRLNVYNTLGQQVAEIFNGRLKEGYHEVDFIAGSLTSGIYFYRLEADKFVDVKKMIVIK
jgi:V8-like Glu-specific endopeptidase